MAARLAVLAHEVVERRLALGGRVPSVGPEAQVDRPPVVADPLPRERRRQRVEVEHALAEGRVRAGLVAARRVLVAGVVAVDKEAVVDPAGKSGDQLQLAAPERLPPPLPPGAPP